MDYQVIGLCLILVGWLIQLALSMLNRKNISALFIGFYAIGAVILAINGFLGGISMTAILNAVIAFIAIIVLIETRK